MTRPHTIRLSLMLAAGFASAAFAAGCGASSRAYAPTETAAREALEASLSAWQKGEKPARLASGTPPVQVSDFQWDSGQALESYKILAEEPDEGDATKRFSASLKLKTSKDETKTRYVVLGREPMLVYREEDYARLINMDNNPRAASTSRRRRP